MQAEPAVSAPKREEASGSKGQQGFYLRGRVVSETESTAGLVVQLLEAGGHPIFASSDGTRGGLGGEEITGLLELHGREEGRLLESKRTDEDGRFEFADLERGVYIVEVPWPDSHDQSRFIVSKTERFVFLNGSSDLGDLHWGPEPLNPERIYIDVTLVSGDGIGSGRVYAVNSEGGASANAKRTKIPGLYSLELPGDVGAVRVFVGSAPHNVRGASAEAAIYPAGERTELTIDVSTGALGINIPRDVELVPSRRIQVVLESPKVPQWVGYHDTVTALGTKFVEGLPELVDVHFSHVLPGNYTLRVIGLEKIEGLGWRTTGDITSVQVLVHGGETQLFEL